jgi:putative flippase GtrA
MEQWIRALPRAMRFLLAGGLSTGVNLAAMGLLVECLQMNSFALKSVANVLAMGIGAVAAFFLHRAWTWEDATKRRGASLLRQFITFMGSLSVGVGSRIGIFAALDYFLGLPYLLNVAIGIAGASILDYFLYDKLVFKRDRAN